VPISLADGLIPGGRILLLLHGAPSALSLTRVAPARPAVELPRAQSPLLAVPGALLLARRSNSSCHGSSIRARPNRISFMAAPPSSLSHADAFCSPVPLPSSRRSRPVWPWPPRHGASLLSPLSSALPLHSSGYRCCSPSSFLLAPISLAICAVEARRAVRSPGSKFPCRATHLSPAAPMPAPYAQSRSSALSTGAQPLLCSSLCLLGRSRRAELSARAQLRGRALLSARWPQLRVSLCNVTKSACCRCRASCIVCSMKISSLWTAHARAEFGLADCSVCSLGPIGVKSLSWRGNVVLIAVAVLATEQSAP
jgi:hypothetical protein